MSCFSYVANVTYVSPSVEDGLLIHIRSWSYMYKGNFSIQFFLKMRVIVIGITKNLIIELLFVN